MRALLARLWPRRYRLLLWLSLGLLAGLLLLIHQPRLYRSRAVVEMPVAGEALALDLEEQLRARATALAWRSEYLSPPGHRLWDQLQLWWTGEVAPPFTPVELAAVNPPLLLVPAGNGSQLCSLKPQRCHPSPLTVDQPLQITALAPATVARTLRRALQVHERGNGRLVVDFTGPYPQSRQLLRDLLNEYLAEKNRTARQGQTQQRQRLQEELHSNGAALKKLTEDRRARFLDQGSGLNLDGTASLDALLKLKLQLSDLAGEEKKLAELYTKDHPSYRALLEKIKLLSDYKNRLEKQLDSAPEDRWQALKFQEEYRQLESRRQHLQQELAQLAEPRPWGEILSVGGGEVVGPAAWPYLGGGAMLFLLLGLAYYLPRSPALGLRDLQGLGPLIGRLPRSAAARPGQVLALEQPEEPALLALRPLWGQIYFSEAQLIGLASLVPGQGGSFCTMNLAVLLAQSGRKSLLIDGNGARPSLARAFKLAAAPAGALGEGIQATAQENLDLLSLGPMQGLNRWLELERLLSQARQGYDFILLDLPPLLAADSGLLLAQLVERLYLVVNLQMSPAQWTQAQLRLAGLTPPAGLLLNGIQEPAAFQGY